jgi:hypothetical protein
MNVSGNDYINTLTITVDAVICHYLYLSVPFSVFNFKLILFL